MTETLPHRPLVPHAAAPVAVPVASRPSAAPRDAAERPPAPAEPVAPGTVVMRPVPPAAPLERLDRLGAPARRVGPSTRTVPPTTVPPTTVPPTTALAPRPVEPDLELPTGDVTLEIRRGRLLVRFSGEIDTALRLQFTRVLGATRAAREPIEVDLSDVTFFSAEGVRMLVLLQGAAGGPGVAAARTSPAVDRTLRLSGIDRYPFLP